MQNSSLIKLLGAIEAELRRLGYLVDDPDPVTADSSPFGYGEMSFEQWLGWVFLPNARVAVDADDLPRSSDVAVAAVRNFDGNDEVDTLLGLLISFDKLINQIGNEVGLPSDT